MSTPQNIIESKIPKKDREGNFNLSLYPVDMSLFLTSPHWSLNAAGVPYHGNPPVYHPNTIAQYALAHWNQYLETNDKDHRRVFLIQARWLAEHEVRIGEDAKGWPLSFPHPDFYTDGSWLSALAQSSGISVVLRAYQISHEETFFDVARHAVRTFNLDILDGGVSTPLGEDGVFFEEVAVYPAAHVLSSFIFALFGLYDYVEVTGDSQVEKLISRSLMTMHRLLDEFDLGYWTRPDLLRGQLSSPAHLALQAMLLEALSKRSGCSHCSMLASRWRTYQSQFVTRLRYRIINNCSFYGQALLNGVRTALFPKPRSTSLQRICVPITAFPVTGGTRSVLANIARVMGDLWQLGYVTQHIGPHAERFTISRFGTSRMSPWQFPNVWLYFLTGFWKLISQQRHGANYHIILPQDGVFTSAFASLAGKLTGVRVVCIDHGNLTTLKSQSFRAERIQALAMKSRPYRLIYRLLYVWYWPSLYLLARISARCVDHFLIPGTSGDGVEEAAKSLGVQTSRITRFRSVIDNDRYVPLKAVSKANTREQIGIQADAIVITLICRLTPEKGIDIALEAISQALSSLSPSLRDRVRVVIAGDGPLRKHIETDILRRGLSQTFLLWGEASEAEVISLLGLSDIFLYTSIRGACLSMAVLEAMASGCAVVASTLPPANIQMLANGRGIAVSPANVVETSMALVRLLNDPDLCRRMANLARDYVVMEHSTIIFRRALMRATQWSALDEILIPSKESEGRQ